MVSVNRESIIKFLMEKAKKELSGPKSGFNGSHQATEILIYCWIVFEAFTCLKYQLGTVDARKKSFCKEFKDEYDYSSLPDECKKAIMGLASYSIPDMTPQTNREPIKIEDIKNLSQIIDSIYRVRCNLFHGGKDMNEIGDLTLIMISGTALYYLLETFLNKQGYL